MLQMMHHIASSLQKNLQKFILHYVGPGGKKGSKMAGITFGMALDGARQEEAK